MKANTKFRFLGAPVSNNAFPEDLPFAVEISFAVSLLLSLALNCTGVWRLYHISLNETNSCVATFLSSKSDIVPITNGKPPGLRKCGATKFWKGFLKRTQDFPSSFFSR